MSGEGHLAISLDTDVLPDVLHATLSLALEIAHEGREGKPVGTSSVIGDTGNVMNHSKQFILNPFYGHHEAERWITDENMRMQEITHSTGLLSSRGPGWSRLPEEI